MAKDISIPAALIFIDALGDTLPFKDRFTFKELSDFCYREGVIGLTGHEVAEPDLLEIAYIVEGITSGHIKIVAGPTQSAVRSPLSKIDLKISNKKASNDCRSCGEPSGIHLLCHACTSTVETKKTAQPAPSWPIEPMKIYAHATLKDGTNLHIVEIRGENYIGVDDEFVAHEFGVDEVSKYANMDEPLMRYGSCDMCGVELLDSICGNCGHAPEL